MMYIVFLKALLRGHPDIIILVVIPQLVKVKCHMINGYLRYQVPGNIKLKLDCDKEWWDPSKDELLV